jgi:ribosomal protein S18 acetylase RimI-like enzyme
VTADINSDNAEKILVGPVQAHVLTNKKAEGFEPLKTFCCGDPSVGGEIGQAIEEVHTIVSRLYNGEAVKQTVVVLEEEGGKLGSGKLVGVCGIRRLKLFETAVGSQAVKAMPPGGYINVIGTDQRYREFKVKKGGTSCGRHLLGRALKQINKEWHGGPMPYVWAAVLTGNDPSTGMFRSQGFQRLDPPFGGFMLRPGRRAQLTLSFQVPAPPGMLGKPEAL